MTGTIEGRAPGVGRPWEVFRDYTIWAVALLGCSSRALAALCLRAAGEGVPGTPPTAAPARGSTVLCSVAGWQVTAAWARRPAAPGPAGSLPAVGWMRGPLHTLVLPVLPAVASLVVLAAGATTVNVAVGCVIGGVSTLALRVPWTWAGGAITAAALLMVPLGLSLFAAVILAVVLTSLVGACRSSLWLAALVRELDLARVAQSRLAVAEERLRFARDLHDVTGRDLSAIAVTGELVAQLVERGDPRAAEHSREVARIARGSLAETRALVRGYREVDLAAELRGTVSLLRSAGASVTVLGGAEDVPAALAEPAAWVLREGGTNVLRHADARSVRIRLGAEGVEVDNDGLRPQPERAGQEEHVEGSGITGLRERFGERASITAGREGERFALRAAFTRTPEEETR